MDSSSSLYVKLQDAENKTLKACQQMLLLSDKLEYLKNKYEKAVADNIKSFRYPLRMRIVVLEGVINMYYQYTSEKHREAEMLRYELFGQEPEFSPFEEE